MTKLGERPRWAPRPPGLAGWPGVRTVWGEGRTRAGPVAAAGTARDVGVVVDQQALSFAGLLRQLRAEARLTQEELAEAAGLSPRSVSDLERGIHPTARKDTAELLAGALGLAGPALPVFVAAARGRVRAGQVLAALRGDAAPGGAAAGQGLAWPGGPYLGLVPFEERDARLFYGRDELADQLVRRLAERPGGAGILLVAGESGSGKSSLLRAGLLPRLAAGGLGPGRSGGRGG